jgi:polyhydroxyalkanoate synthesis regulator phasin
MTFFTLDTLKFSKRLQKVGLDQKIADEVAEAIKETQSQAIDGLATKNDIVLVRKDLEILDRKIDSVKNEIITKMFMMLTLSVAVVAWLDKVIN